MPDRQIQFRPTHMDVRSTRRPHPTQEGASSDEQASAAICYDPPEDYPRAMFSTRIPVPAVEDPRNRLSEHMLRHFCDPLQPQPMRLLIGGHVVIPVAFKAVLVQTLVDVIHDGYFVEFIAIVLRQNPIAHRGHQLSSSEEKKRIGEIFSTLARTILRVASSQNSF